MSIIHRPSRLSLASLPTPLQPLKRLSNHLGGPMLWVKRDDMTGSILSGNKVRKLEYTLAYALEQGHDLLITCGGTQSNHCRATAFACAQLGLPIHLVLRGSGESDGNLLLDQLAGASISCYSPRDYRQHLDHILEESAQTYRDKGFNPYIIPTGASNGVGVWGYFAACEELQKDFDQHGIAPQLIVTATGSAGTQAGLTLGSAYYALGASVLGIAVCDSSDYFHTKVTADIAEFADQFESAFAAPLPTNYSINTNDNHIGKGYGLASDEVLNTIATVARTEGLLLDPVYTGKAFHGLLQELMAGAYADMTDIVFIHTGGSFGLFPYRQQFQSILTSTDNSFELATGVTQLSQTISIRN